MLSLVRGSLTWKETLFMSLAWVTKVCHLLMSSHDKDMRVCMRVYVCVHLAVHVCVHTFTCMPVHMNSMPALLLGAHLYWDGNVRSGRCREHTRRPWAAFLWTWC